MTTTMMSATSSESTIESVKLGDNEPPPSPQTPPTPTTSIGSRKNGPQQQQQHQQLHDNYNDNNGYFDDKDNNIIQMGPELVAAAAAAAAAIGRREFPEAKISVDTGGGDFSDMPSLSSYRSWDDKSAASSSIRTGGGGSVADCDVSLPSLSSFRLDDLSMASSYHTIGSAATKSNFSEESVEGWGSFTSGNVSKSDCTDSENDDDDDDENGDNNNGDADDDGSDIFIPQTVSNELHYGRMNHRSAALTPPPAAIETKSILRNKGEGLSKNETISASQISLLSLDDPGGGGGIRRIRKRSSQVPMPSSAESFDGIPKSNVEVTTIHTGEISTPSEINGSRSMNETINASNSDNVNVHNNLPPPVPQPAKRAPSPTRGSLERNVSLPLTELQRPAKDRQQSSDSSFRYSADGSSASMRGMGDSLPRLPRRTSTMADDVDDGTDNKGRNEEKNTVQTENQNDDDIQHRDIGNDEASAASDSSLSDDLSLSIASDGDESADCSVETVEEDSVRLQQPSTTHSSLSEPQQQQEVSEVHVEVQQSIEDEIPEANSKDNVGLSVMETNPTSVDVAKSPSLDVNDEYEDQPSEELTTLKPPRSKKQTKNNGEESGATIGTESEPETDSPAVESGKKTDPKRGNLIRRMSSTLRNAGKSASFRGSFKKIGKTASKIRQISRRKDADNDSSDVKPS